MVRTAKQIQGDVMQLLIKSGLPDIISGDVYRKGYRPQDSKKEDAVVIFTTADAEQIQSGVVTIHIYVPDIKKGGVMVENGKRTEVVEMALQSFCDSLASGRSEYRFRQQMAIDTLPSDDIQQHFVVAYLQFEILTN